MQSKHGTPDQQEMKRERFMAVVRKSIDADYTEWDAQLAVARLFRYRNGNIAFPSYTTFGWEMDVGIVTGSRYLYEIEIKRTASDWKADEAKAKWAMSRAGICKFYYAIPPELLSKKPSFVSDDTGIIFLNKPTNPYQGFKVYAEIHKEAKRLSKEKIDDKRLNYMLGVFYHRYWSLRLDMGRRIISESDNEKLIIDQDHFEKCMVSGEDLIKPFCPPEITEKGL